MQPGAEGYERLREVFGMQFFQDDGGINRALLRQKVFDEEAVKEGLENILHPLVGEEVLACHRECTAAGRRLVVEVPLLFEVGWQDMFENTVVVYAPRQLCIDRVAARDGLTGHQISKIISSQMDLMEKRRMADYCIDNSGTFAATMQQTLWCAADIRGKKKSGHSAEIGLKSLTANS
jgi:dephospho-CoA kinase